RDAAPPTLPSSGFPARGGTTPRAGVLPTATAPPPVQYTSVRANPSRLNGPGLPATIGNSRGRLCHPSQRPVAPAGTLQERLWWDPVRTPPFVEEAHDGAGGGACPAIHAAHVSLSTPLCDGALPCPCWRQRLPQAPWPAVDRPAHRSHSRPSSRRSP